MDVLLLGTGSDTGWPDPRCTCASCQQVRAAGLVRGPTAALVGDVLLLDCGASTGPAAQPACHPLTAARHVLVTRPDAALGPPVKSAHPGDQVTLAGYDIRVFAASGDGGQPAADRSLMFDVRRSGARLLFAPDVGTLPSRTLAACTGAAYHMVLLDGCDADTLPRHVAALRLVGAITDRTDVVAVSLGHRNPAPAELARRLRLWGVRAVSDGTVLRVGDDAEDDGDEGGERERGRWPRRTLVLGGSRSGKSVEAERQLAAEPRVLYVATGGDRPDDPEWQLRVAAHRARRSSGWETVETCDVAGVLRRAEHPVLVDCLGLWLTAVLDATGAWTGSPDSIAAVRARMADLVTAWREVRVPVVAVSNEVGSGVVPSTAAGRLFRDELGRLNAALAAESEHVLLVVAGRVLAL